VLENENENGKGFWVTSLYKKGKLKYIKKNNDSLCRKMVYLSIVLGFSKLTI